MFKFNNGNGAIVCDACYIIIKQPAIPPRDPILLRAVQTLNFCSLGCEIDHLRHLAQARVDASSKE